MSWTLLHFGTYVYWVCMNRKYEIVWDGMNIRIRRDTLPYKSQENNSIILISILKSIYYCLLPLYLVICFFHVQSSRKSTSVWNCGRALMPSGEVLGRWAEPHPSHLKWPFLLRFCVHQFCLFLGAGLLSLHLIRSSSSVIFNVRGACYFYSLKCTHWVLKQKKSQGLLKF